MDPITPEQKPPVAKCKNCGESFKVNPKRKANSKNQTHEFCKAACRKQFHRYGTSFEQVMRRVDELIDKRLMERAGALSALSQQVEALENKITYMKEMQRYDAAQRT